MKDEKFRKALDEYAIEREMTVKVFDDRAYDNSIVGITDGGVLVYDYEKMVEEIMEEDGCEEIEAVEWIEYNTMRALPYMGDGAPIVIHPKSDIDMYGED